MLLNVLITWWLQHQVMLACINGQKRQLTFYLPAFQIEYYFHLKIHKDCCFASWTKGRGGARTHGKEVSESAGEEKGPIGFSARSQPGLWAATDRLGFPHSPPPFYLAKEHLMAWKSCADWNQMCASPSSCHAFNYGAGIWKRLFHSDFVFLSCLFLSLAGSRMVPGYWLSWGQSSPTPIVFTQLLWGVWLEEMSCRYPPLIF